MTKRTWLVTGSSRGFGRALAEAVLDAGDNLVATARNPAALSGIADGRAGQLVIQQLDVTDSVQAEAAVEVARKRFGRLDILVLQLRINPFSSMTTGGDRLVYSPPS
ncbi:SDR family NAD(P)-dependent oxidoreductase [Flavisphingomonas formosensis]|uniref:SDR family NAD(P)-dependent oxidoreductase n=1 Tax=Flavisphingomonas formosensis TaxID=861534 RepID=UPI0012FB6C16|nr:SDR family NAD(P)-dependent oxidoreductase [Sphingomonas formosensis]